MKQEEIDSTSIAQNPQDQKSRMRISAVKQDNGLLDIHLT
jgi:hypothetical protein